MHMRICVRAYLCVVVREHPCVFDCECVHSGAPESHVRIWLVNDQSADYYWLRLTRLTKADQS